jgi:16S rRNA (guanine966-N2)-methyltransferase
MRVIGGIHRGRRLAAPEGLATRPMTDRVRENLFNILAAEVPGAVVLDLFAGSGALGLEALSRGARWCTFVERDEKALNAIETNCRALRLERQARGMRQDALRPGDWVRLPGGERYTLLLADPPYALTADAEGRRRLAAMAQTLAALGCLAPGAVAMVRMKRGTPMDTPWNGFAPADERTYGSTTLHLMRYAPPAR